MGSRMCADLQSSLDNYKIRLLIGSDQEFKSLISTFFDLIVFCMVLYFLIQIIHQMAMKNARRSIQIKFK